MRLLSLCILFFFGFAQESLSFIKKKKERQFAVSMLKITVNFLLNLCERVYLLNGPFNSLNEIQYAYSLNKALSLSLSLCEKLKCFCVKNFPII